MKTSCIQYSPTPQTSLNIKNIHNYSYYTDRVIGSGNFSTVYEAYSNTTRTISFNVDEKIAAKLVKMASLTFKKL